MPNYKLRIVLVISVLVWLFIATATKAAHWDKIVHKTTALNQLDEVYPGLEGCIIIDAILMVMFLALIIIALYCDPKYIKYLIFLISVVLCIRFVLSLLFLAGNDNYCKNMVDYCSTATKSYCTGGNCYYTWCGESVFKTLEAAWIVEIIAVILVNVCSVCSLVLVYQIIHH